MDRQVVDFLFCPIGADWRGRALNDFMREHPERELEPKLFDAKNGVVQVSLLLEPGEKFVLENDEAQVMR